MDDKRTPVKAKKNCSEKFLKKRKPKKEWKMVVETDVLVKRLKRTDAEDRSIWRLGCKNWLTHACGENKPGSRKMKNEKMKRLLKQINGW